MQNKRRIHFEQAYPDIPESINECKKVLAFFKDNYNVEDTIELYNTEVKELEEVYERIKGGLREAEGRRTRSLIFHVFCGHSMEKDGMQTFMINQPDMWEKGDDCKHFDDYNNFYMRFEAEKHIRDLATRFPNSYHVGLFLGYSGTQVDGFEFFSIMQTRIYSDNIINIVLNKDESKEYKLLKELTGLPADAIAKIEAENPNWIYRQLSSLAKNKIISQDFNKLQSRIAKIYQFSKSRRDIDSIAIIRFLDNALGKASSLSPDKCRVPLLIELLESLLIHLNSQKGVMQLEKKVRLAAKVLQEVEKFLQDRKGEEQDWKHFYLPQAITTQEKLGAKQEAKEQANDKLTSTLDKLPMMDPSQLSQLFTT